MKSVFWESNKVGSHIALVKASLSIFNIFIKYLFKS